MEFADQHVFPMQLSISLVGEKPAKHYVATFGMADWNLRPSHVLADCSCRRNGQSTHSSCATVKRRRSKLMIYSKVSSLIIFIFLSIYLFYFETKTSAFYRHHTIIAS